MNKMEIAQLIMDRFKELNYKSNDVIDSAWIYHNIFLKLNPSEQDILEQAINSLVEKKFITKEKRAIGDTLVLTDIGFDAIYPFDKSESKMKIQSLIMHRFKELKSRPNHVIDQRWISMELVKHLNPKERGILLESIEDFAEQDYILIENRNGMDCIVLTQKGYDAIYK